MPILSFHHTPITASTNLDARTGVHGDIFSADFQTAGRGRLNHTWEASAGSNALFSVVVDVSQMEVSTIVTFPLVVGLAVIRALKSKVDNLQNAAPPCTWQLKWPNDVWVNGKKIGGILCERVDNRIIAGVGINVNELTFPPALENRATSLTLISHVSWNLPTIVRDTATEIFNLYDVWTAKGFAALYPQFLPLDALRGKHIAVLQTDTDSSPIQGVCGGIQSDGTLLVGHTPIFAGEAHIVSAK